MTSLVYAKPKSSTALAVIGLATLCFYTQGLEGQAKPIPAKSGAERTFDGVRSSPPELRAFLERFPKGADLHSHLGGANYAEGFIRAAVEDNLCVDIASMSLIPNVGTTRSIPPHPVCSDKSAPAASALKDQKFYDALVDAFSMRSFVPSAGVSGHDHFFATFSRFQPVISPKRLGDWVHEIAARAASQNEQYVEIMHTPSFDQAAKLGYEIGWTGDLAATRQALLSKGIGQNAELDRKELDTGEADLTRLEHCSETSKAEACDVKVRYLFQVLRGNPPEQVFAQTLLGFELASIDSRVVGINFVMPEDSYMSMSEYHRQMEMLDYLHSVYPKIHIALHAGELAPGMVPPDGLQFHIREAVELGHAERIGHGVDVMYEREPHRLLEQMAAKHIAVEINLTSNDLILGIRGKDHPLPVYQSAHVPVALATDDEGVSRIDITHEYQRAVQEFGFGYEDLKNNARTSLEHSFLPGSSLWKSPDAFTRTASSCEGISPGAPNPPKACTAFLASSEKAQEQWRLEARFRSFEADFQ